MSKNKRYRIKEIKCQNHTEYWVEESIRIFGIHLFWNETTSSYHRTLEYAKRDLEDRVGKKIETIYTYK